MGNVFAFNFHSPSSFPVKLRQFSGYRHKIIHILYCLYLSSYIFFISIMMIMFLGILMNGKYIDERLTIEKQQALLTTTKKDSML